MTGDRVADARVTDALRALERAGTQRNREGMARYGIVAPKVFGVSVGDVQRLAKRYGRNHSLALELWATGWYEARLLAAFVDEPERVTPVQMDRWARDFDNWGICDTVIMHLFDRTPYAWAKVEKWCSSKEEFVKRAGFALIASLALHDKTGPDAPYVKALRLVQREAKDERNFVKKAVNWALRAVGSRDLALHARAVALATKLAASDDVAARWNGKDALRQLATPATRKRLERAAARQKALHEALREARREVRARPRSKPTTDRGAAR